MLRLRITNALCPLPAVLKTWMSTAASFTSKPARTKKEMKKSVPEFIIEASKENIAQSPWKMNFLVKLVRGAWLPDALAQLKFSPKHRAVDVAKIVQRAAAVARIHHEAIPEELMIREIFVTKGLAQKRMRIMGRGRTGIGYMRKSHVTVKVEKINFEEKIALSFTQSQKIKWAKIQALVVQKRKTLGSSSSTSVSKSDAVVLPTTAASTTPSP